MKFVPELSDDLQHQLEGLLKSSSAHRVRQRALPDAPKPGRPSKLSEAEEDLLLEAVANNPQRIDEALAELKKRRARS